MVNEAVWQAVICSEPLLSNQTTFSPEETQIIVLLRALCFAGVSHTELYKLCGILLQDSVSHKEKIAYLRTVRFDLLGRIHGQQQVLDELDNYVDTLRKL